MAQACPISSQQVNGRACQVNAFFTVVCILVFLCTSAKWVILPLAGDFLLRGFLNPSFSPVNNTSNAILRLCKVKPQLTNAGPKIFAAKMAFVFICITALSWLAGYNVVAMFFAITLAFFATLEAGFSYCVACKAYPLVCRMRGSAS
ncbi:MAG: DUF4395 domain-containing protein [Desulfuromonas sp.]|nr:DUF4395 domain-containing protein [Desulfuromonas sp.]